MFPHLQTPPPTHLPKHTQHAYLRLHFLYPHLIPSRHLHVFFPLYPLYLNRNSHLYFPHLNGLSPFKATPYGSLRDRSLYTLTPNSLLLTAPPSASSFARSSSEDTRTPRDQCYQLCLSFPLSLIHLNPNSSSPGIVSPPPPSSRPSHRNIMLSVPSCYPSLPPA